MFNQRQNKPESFSEAVRALEDEWLTNPRWATIRRDYTAEHVIRLRGSFAEEFTIARNGARKLYSSLTERGKGKFVRALGAVTGCQAVQMVKAGMLAVCFATRKLTVGTRSRSYLSEWLASGRGRQWRAVSGSEFVPIQRGTRRRATREQRSQKGMIVLRSRTRLF